MPPWFWQEEYLSDLELTHNLTTPASTLGNALSRWNNSRACQNPSRMGSANRFPLGLWGIARFRVTSYSCNHHSLGYWRFYRRGRARVLAPVDGGCGRRDARWLALLLVGLSLSHSKHFMLTDYHTKMNSSNRYILKITVLFIHILHQSPHLIYITHIL